ncbi:hypothetical protein [Longispora albida]|uniref:hypothetical protein n=1 Tax=Longispora albida TaxID=203523 RepID=UPI00038040B2|nr:hypothetical protein [Longispora albida]
MAIESPQECARALEKISRALFHSRNLAVSIDRAQAALMLADPRNSGLTTLIDHALENAEDITRYLRALPAGDMPAV